MFIATNDCGYDHRCIVNIFVLEDCGIKIMGVNFVQKYVVSFVLVEIKFGFDHDDLYCLPQSTVRVA